MSRYYRQIFYKKARGTENDKTVEVKKRLIDQDVYFAKELDLHEFKKYWASLVKNTHFAEQLTEFNNQDDCKSGFLGQDFKFCDDVVNT